MTFKKPGIARSVGSCLLLAIGCTSPQDQGRLTAQGTTAKNTAFFVSIDGLQADLLQELRAERRLTAARGFDWLLRGSMTSTEARPIVTSLTAASHASIITCTPPSRNGIIGNGFLQDGKKINGFAQEFATEPLWLGAAAQGKTVLSLGYVGTDGTTAKRRADYGLAYPLDSLMGGTQSLTLKRAELPSANGWVLPAQATAAAPGKAWREAQITLTLNPKTGETRTVDLLIQPGLGPQDFHISFATDKNLARGALAEMDIRRSALSSVDLFFKEEDPDSTMRGVKRRVIVSSWPSDDESLALYVSKASYNQAYPESFRQELDDRNLVWPDYGIKDSRVSLTHWVEAQATIDRFLVDVATVVVPETGIDIVLFYQQLLDALGHKMQAKLPRPFRGSNQDEVTQAYVRAFSLVDEHLSQLFSMPQATGPAFVMGDHGMDAVRKVVNVAPFLPKGHEDKVEILASGDLLLLYPLFSNPDRDQAMKLALKVGEELKEQLSRATFEGTPVLGFARKVTDYSEPPSNDLTQEWQYGQAVWAFAGTSGFWYQYQPLQLEPFSDPPALGMHGKSQISSDMATMFMAKGPMIPAGDLGEMDLLDAVPTFAAAIGIAPPRDCLGRSLLGRRRP